MCCKSSKGKIPTDFPNLPSLAETESSSSSVLPNIGQGNVVQLQPLAVKPKAAVYIPPQPMCQFKSITCGVLDRLGAYIPGGINSSDGQSTYSQDLEGNQIQKRKKMHRRCLCDTIKPILKLSQYVGVVPLSIYHPDTPDTPETMGHCGKSSGTCQLVFQWKSFGAVFNTVLTIAFLGYLPFSFTNIKNRMGQVFDGTDLYAFTVQNVAMFFETTILLLSGRFLRCKFMRGWAELNEVYHALCDSAGDLQRIKVSSYIASMIIMIELIGFFLYNFLTACNAAIGKYPTYLDLGVWSLASNLTLFIPYTLSTLFLFICLLIRSHFVKIAEMLDFVVKKPNTPKLHLKIDSLRVLHEQLCQAVSDFETFFGVQILLTLCTGCFTVTTGAYASIVQFEGISSSKTQQESAAWGMQMYSAAIFMLLILIAGQLMTNAASSPAPVLNSLSFVDLDASSRIQVQAFLQKISAFPTKMSALKITNVSTTFLASAATNITTYLLVLMQFKLSLENSSCGKDTLNIQKNGSEFNATTFD